MPSLRKPPSPRKPPSRLPSRDTIERQSLADLRRADSTRTILICGVMLLGSFPCSPLDDVLAEICGALAEGQALACLPYPRCLRPTWRWEPEHEDLSLWHAGRLVALISRDAAGDLAVRRF